MAERQTKQQKWTLHEFIVRLQRRIALNKRSFIIYAILRLLVLVTAIRCFITQRHEELAICVLSLVLFLIPPFIEETAAIEVPALFQAIIYLFIFAAEILGEVGHYYVLVPWWDTMLHTINGFLCAAVGFSLVDLLNRSTSSINLSSFYVALVAFCFSMTIGVLWEFIEFGVDSFAGLDMQKDTIVSSFTTVSLDTTNEGARTTVEGIEGTTVHAASGDVEIEGGYLDIGIHDTMKDLLVNFVGAIVCCTGGYLALENHVDDVGFGFRLTHTTAAQRQREEMELERMGRHPTPRGG